MQHFTKTLAAGGAIIVTWPGKVLSMKACTLPLMVSFDSGDSHPVKGGQVIPRADEFNNVNFVNNNSVSVTFDFYIGDEAAPYAPADNSQSNASSYAFGNLGVAVGAGAVGGLPACDANGFLQITNALALVVPGTNNGHRRQIITFSMSSSSPAPLNLLDANGCAYMTILAGQQIQLVTDATFTLSGAGGTAWVSVGQIFLNN
jgi:hypothetical protein